MKIVGITGLARSGKTTSAEYLSKKYGLPIYNFSDVIKHEAAKRKLEPTKDNLSKLGDDLRAEHGMGAIAKLLMREIKPEESIIVTGFRSPEEVDMMRNEAESFILIELKADPKLRYEREEEKIDENEFYTRDERDVKKKGLGKVIKIADYHIVNDKTLKDLYSNIEKILKEEGFLEA